MAKEKGLISLEDFAQLQKFIECEPFSCSFSSGDFFLMTLHASVPAPRSGLLTQPTLLEVQPLYPSSLLTACPRPQRWKTGYCCEGANMFLPSCIGSFLLTHLTCGCPSRTLAEGQAILVFLSYSDSTKRVSDVLRVFDDGEMNRFCQGDVSGMAHAFLDYLSTGIPNFQKFLWARFLLSPL